MTLSCELTSEIWLTGGLPWASYQIPKIACCACAGNAGNVFPRRRFQRKLLVSDPGMHHGTCVTHVPWCMSGSLICGDGENVPGIPGACAPAILRIWQEAHWSHYSLQSHCLNQGWIISKMSARSFSGQWVNSLCVTINLRSTMINNEMHQYW